MEDGCDASSFPGFLGGGFNVLDELDELCDVESGAIVKVPQC